VRHENQDGYHFKADYGFGLTYTRSNNTRSNFTDVQRIVVTSAAFRVGMEVRWVLPGLREATVVEEDISFLELYWDTSEN
jgi:hypothetical protein